MLKMLKYILLDILKSKILITYTLILLGISFSLLSFEENTSKAILSMLNITLIVVPLVSIVFTTIHYYNDYEFIELMLAQPLRRKNVFMGEVLGCMLSLAIAYFAGFGIPLLILDGTLDGALLLLLGILLSAVFSSLAMLVSVSFADKAKGIGVSLLVWLATSLLYDGLVLFFMMNFSDYPIEKSILVLTFFNPIDLARISMLMKMDISVIMGYSGAIYKNFLGTSAGLYTAFGILLLWICLPLFFAVRKFSKKDI